MIKRNISRHWFDIGKGLSTAMVDSPHRKIKSRLGQIGEARQCSDLSDGNKQGCPGVKGPHL